MSAIKPSGGPSAESQTSTLLVLQRKLLAIVAHGGSLQERLDRTCQLFEQVVQGMVATVMRIDPAHGRLHFISAPSAPRELLDELDDARLGEGRGSCAYAAWAGEPTYVGDAVHDPHWADIRHVAETYGVRSCWSSPVCDREGTVQGTFALTSLHERVPDAYHQQLLDLGALSIGLLFDQEREETSRLANERTNRRLALIASSTPNGILIVDAEGVIEWSNASALDMLGRTSEVLVGSHLSDVLDALVEDQQVPALQDAIDRSRPYTDTLQLKRPSGSTLAVKISYMPRQPDDNGDVGAAVILVDVSALHRLSEFNVLLAQVDNALSRITDPGHLLQEICDLAVRHAGFGLAWIGRPESETGLFRPLAAAGPGRHYLDEVRISSVAELPEGRGPCGDTWHDGRSRFDGSFEHDPKLKPWARAARQHGFAAIAVLPIHRAGELWAEFCVYHKELHSFDATLQQLLETLALNISTGLDRIDLAHREREIQALNQSMLESASVGVVLTRNRVILRANRRAAEILGAPDPETLVGVSTLKLYADAETGEMTAQRVHHAFEANKRAIIEVEARRLDGREIWLRLEGVPFHHEGYDEIWSLIDQTDQHRAIETKLLLANALASVQEGVIITGADQRVVYINEAFHTLTGYDFEQMRGHNCNILQGPQTNPDTVARIREALGQGREFIGEILNYRRDGKRFWNLLTINPLRDEHGQISHFVGVQRDITDLRDLNERLEHLAFHDELTGLPNRRALDRYFARTLPRVVAGKYTLALGIIDLDDFKIINDTHGHDCGDRLLKTVTERIRPRLGDGDFFARLGGDEFVIVFLENRTDAVEERLHERFESIGECFVEPFDIGLDSPIRMALSMGVALCPDHAEAGGMLLRLADEALFRAKKHKLDRAHWWAIHGEAEPQELGVTVEAYGPLAAEVLNYTRPHLTGIQKSIVDEFYALLEADPHASRILHGLGPGEIERLKQRQIEHMHLLMQSDITRVEMIDACRRIGRTHALIGIDSVLLMRWMSVYHERLTQQCGLLPIGPKQRYQLVQLLEHRLQDDLQAQMEAQTAVQDRYASIIDQFLPEKGSGWNDSIGLEIRLLARLPGISSAMILRPSRQDTFSIESSAGATARAVSRMLREQYGNSDSTPFAPSDDSLIMQAWHAVEIRTVSSLGLPEGESHGPLPTSLARTGTHSAACIPILDEQRLPVALLLLVGKFANQFESKYMQHFMRNMQLRGNEIWQRSMRPPPPVPHEKAVAYRRRLFKGGLRMMLQPVIDLGTGQPVKVEALARLEQENGELLGPDTFLPLLRHTELDTLFQHGLDMGLRDLVDLDRQGMRLDLALNISPHTLAVPECRIWVQEALERHGVEPSRLVLEILENQRVDRKARDPGVQRLIDLGVRLAIDDLGSGYSSLRRLASLPFHAVKVDQDLLTRLHVDPVQSVSLISAVVQIGRDFGCQVIAEGLEDDGMIEVARLLGATMGQGYAIAHPMTAAELPAWRENFHYEALDARPRTRLGALAFQWISIRHGSLHPPELSACPLTPLLSEDHEHTAKAAALHAAVHADPGNEAAARRLLDQLQDDIRRDTGDSTGEWT